MIRNDPMNQRCRLLMDETVVAMVGASEGRPNRVLVNDSRGSAVQKRFLMAPNRVRPGDAVVPSTDLPEPSWLSGASPRSP